MKRLLILFFIFFALPLAAQEGGVQEAKLQSLPQTALAREFNLTFILPVGSAVTFDPASFDAKDFELINTSQGVKDDGNVHFTFTLVPFALGEVVFAPVTLTAQDGALIQTPPVTLNVDKAKTGIKSDDIIDIRGPYRPVDWWLWTAVLLVCIILIITGVLIYAAYKKKRLPAPAAAQEKPDLRPIEVIARERIAFVLNSELWDRAEYKKFYSALTDILKWYLQKRYCVATEVQTTTELLRNIKKTEAKEILGELRTFFSAADMVKFAAHIPALRERDGDIKLLRFIIDAAAPAVKEEGKA